MAEETEARRANRRLFRSLGNRPPSPEYPEAPPPEGTGDQFLEQQARLRAVAAQAEAEEPSLVDEALSRLRGARDTAAGLFEPVHGVGAKVQGESDRFNTADRIATFKRLVSSEPNPVTLKGLTQGAGGGDNLKLLRKLVSSEPNPVTLEGLASGGRRDLPEPGPMSYEEAKAAYSNPSGPPVRKPTPRATVGLAGPVRARPLTAPPSKATEEDANRVATRQAWRSLGTRPEGLYLPDLPPTTRHPAAVPTKADLDPYAHTGGTSGSLQDPYLPDLPPTTRHPKMVPADGPKGVLARYQARKSGPPSAPGRTPPEGPGAVGSGSEAVPAHRPDGVPQQGQQAAAEAVQTRTPAPGEKTASFSDLGTSDADLRGELDAARRGGGFGGARGTVTSGTAAALVDALESGSDIMSGTRQNAGAAGRAIRAGATQRAQDVLSKWKEGRAREDQGLKREDMGLRRAAEVRNAALFNEGVGDRATRRGREAEDRRLAAEARDPNSRANKIARAQATALYPKEVGKIPPEVFSQATADDLKAFLGELPQKAAGAGRGVGAGGSAEDREVERRVKMIPKNTQSLRVLLRDARGAIARAGGPDKVQGVGGWMGVGALRPTITMDEASQEFHQARQQLANLNANQLFGSALSANEAARFDAAVASVKLGRSMQQVLRGMQIIEDMTEAAYQQSQAGRTPGAAKRIEADMALPSPTQPPERVRVTNGTETLEIDRADLKDAEADGFRVAP